MLPKYRINLISKLAVLLVTGGMIAVSSPFTLAEDGGNTLGQGSLVGSLADGASSVAAEEAKPDTEILGNPVSSHDLWMEQQEKEQQRLSEWQRQMEERQQPKFL
ncbi:hypothetical protein [Pasteuria penetrans]|uniref:hypothetical protein n=1 Tax=Pasteuria penetrans TaxID=86005 RepID=UPI000F998F17|nr:hypothetical protein [Pasteuria penetrans]